MKEPALDEFVAIAEQAARRGGEILKNWEGQLGVRSKGRADLVTEADLASQKAIRELVLGKFPDHGFLGEEDPVEPEGKEFVWVVDPLDGTTNYVHRCPFYSVSVALKRNDELMAGVVFDPELGESFCAARGHGAWLGTKRLRVSETNCLSDALVVTSFPPGVQKGDEQVRHFLNVLERGQSVRRTGSAALNLAYVAAGRFDAFWATSMHSWDVGAGVLLVAEAGGRCSQFNGQPYQIDDARLLSSNGTDLHEEIAGLIGESDD